MTLKIRKRSPTCYELRYTTNGEQKSIYGKSRLDCREKLKAVKLANKKPRIYHSMSFNIWFEKWVDLYKKPNLKQNTLNNMLNMFKKYVLADLGTRSLRVISSEDIQIIINKLGNFPRQATILYNYLNSCFNQAFMLNLIGYNPCSAVVIKKTNGEKGKALTREEELKLIEYLNSSDIPIKNLILIYLYTGMRRSELLSLKSTDLDIENNLIHIPGTKTKNSDRTIQVKPEIFALFPQKQRLFEGWSGNKVNSEFKKICDLLGFKDITLHSLRHSFATRCIENGVDMVVVQEWLGHSSISLTIDTYTHISEEYKREELKKLSYRFLP